MRLVFRALAALFAVAALAGCDAGKPEPGTETKGALVFAAASLTDVMNTIGDRMAAAGKPVPRFSFAGSSALARQVESGVEADVFISADEEWMDYLANKSLIEPGSRRTLLTNTLVLAAPSGAPFQLDLKPGMDLAVALKGGKLSLAEPDSVPAGRYAKEALESLGAWSGVQSSVVRADNVRAALRYVETGDAAAGIVYATDALAAGDRVFVVGTFPQDSHTPVSYPAALLVGKAGGPGEEFLNFLNSEEARRVFQAAGFGVVP